MENGPFIDGLPIKNGDLSIAMLNYQRVTQLKRLDPSYLAKLIVPQHSSENIHKKKSGGQHEKPTPEAVEHHAPQHLHGPLGKSPMETQCICHAKEVRSPHK
jgi:hypothetical protein